MTIHQTYNSSGITTVPDYAQRPENWRELIDSMSDFHTCNHYTHSTTRVIVFDAGGATGELLDASNGISLHALAESWESFDMDADDTSSAYDSVKSEWPIITHHGMYDYTAVCIDPDEISADVLALILERRKSFDDYPVIDEEHYSELEFTTFFKCFDDESFYIDNDYDAHHPAYICATEYAMDHFYGMSDPGYISREDVEECWIHATAAIAERDYDAHVAGEE